MADIDVDAAPGPSQEGPSSSGKKDRRFEIKKWNAVALWAWGEALGLEQERVGFLPVGYGTLFKSKSLIIHSDFQDPTRRDLTYATSFP